jgi:hypothetical protein
LQSKETYRDLNYALKKLRSQIMEGVPYAQTYCPQFDTPKEAFNWLKTRTIYTKDPKGIELFQTLPTLLDDNFHGVTGSGDCDCFTIALLTLLVANGLYKDCGIVLVGRNRFVPVHIYAYTYIDGERTILDLTNKIYNVERFYPYFQEIPLLINKNEEKNMFLQLAEDFLSGKGKAGRQAVKSAKREVNTQKKINKVEGKALKKDLKFQTKSGNLKTSYDANVPEISPVITDNYTYLPDSDIHVRNDVYDDMDSAEFQNQMLEEGVSPHKILELSGARAARKMVKSSAKAQSKAQKRISKTEGKVNRRQFNTENKNRISSEDKGKLLNKLTDTAGGVINKFTGATTPTPTDTPETNTPKTTTGGGFVEVWNSIPMPVKIIGGITIAGGIAYAIKNASKK